MTWIGKSVSVSCKVTKEYLLETGNGTNRTTPNKKKHGQSCIHIFLFVPNITQETIESTCIVTVDYCNMMLLSAIITSTVF